MNFHEGAEQDQRLLAFPSRAASSIRYSSGQEVFAFAHLKRVRDGRSWLQKLIIAGVANHLLSFLKYLDGSQLFRCDSGNIVVQCQTQLRLSSQVAQRSHGYGAGMAVIVV